MKRKKVKGKCSNSAEKWTHPISIKDSLQTVWVCTGGRLMHAIITQCCFVITDWCNGVRARGRKKPSSFQFVESYGDSLEEMAVVTSVWALFLLWKFNFWRNLWLWLHLYWLTFKLCLIIGVYAKSRARGGQFRLCFFILTLKQKCWIDSRCIWRQCDINSF